MYVIEPMFVNLFESKSTASKHPCTSCTVYVHMPYLVAYIHRVRFHNDEHCSDQA